MHWFLCPASSADTQQHYSDIPYYDVCLCHILVSPNEMKTKIVPDL